MISYHTWSVIIPDQLSFMISYHPCPVIIQTSNDKNYYQNPTNLDESWSVGISITCSSCQTCSEASRSVSDQVQTSNHKNYIQNPTNLDESWSVGIVRTCSSSHRCSQASRSRSANIFFWWYRPNFIDILECSQDHSDQLPGAVLKLAQNPCYNLLVKNIQVSQPK